MVGRQFKIAPWFAGALFAWHMLFCLLYTVFTYKQEVDSFTYYTLTYVADLELGLGTEAIPYLASYLVVPLGLGYLPTNIIFATISLCGVYLIFDALRSVTLPKHTYIIAALAFAPSMHFFTGGIGKDGIALLATGFLAQFAVRPKLATAMIGIGLYLIVRPHMAGIFLLSGTMGIIFVTGRSAFVRVAILAVLAGGLALLLPYITGLLVQYTDGEASVLSFIANRQQMTALGGSAINLLSMSLPEKLFAFVFRPFVLEARSAISLIIAVENLFFLLAFLHLLRGLRFRKIWNNDRLQSAAIMCFFTFGSWWFFATTTYNLGLASRQKWMVLPLIFLVLLAACRHANKRSADLQSPDTLEA